jgi:hypothetical protein
LDFVHLINRIMTLIFICVQNVPMNQFLTTKHINVKAIIFLHQVWLQIFVLYRLHTIMMLQKHVNNALYQNLYLILLLNLVNRAPKIVQVTIQLWKFVNLVHKQYHFITQHKKNVNHAKNLHRFIIKLPNLVKNVQMINPFTIVQSLIAWHAQLQQHFFIHKQILVRNVH